MRPLLVMLAVVALGFAPVPFRKPDPVKSELQKLQGEWELTRWDAEGGRVEVSPGDYRVVIVKDGFSHYNRANLLARSVLRFDRTRPGVMEVKRSDGEADETIHLRYRVEGDTLTYAFHNANVRPDAPARLAPGEGVTFKVFRRKKP
jgi:uncharacterized protein (TIGR03067 family)